ncbi:MAG TPA: glycosyltransferase family 2 protein, partial [Acidobacteriota bacterium]
MSRNPRFFSSRFSWDRWEPAFRLAIMVAGAAILGWSLYTGRLFPGLWGNTGARPATLFLRLLLTTTTTIFIASIVWRTIFWFRYRKADATMVKEWPVLTILLPAYNEGAAVFATVGAIAASDYPRGRLKIIAVDDGSQDDTYAHLLRAGESYPGLLEIIRFAKNRGKRHALYEAFRRVRTPLVITVDSDTEVAVDGIRELVTPLLLDPALGAATGRIRILNSKANLFTRMLDVNFAMAFDFTRAIESTFSSVFCTSGAFSVYRTCALERVLDEWRDQRFLGRPCSYGEDRSLANYLLRLGYGTVFQRSALARTRVPESLGRILKM